MKGVFTTVRVENGAPLFLEEHLSRLRRHASEMGLLFSAAALPPLPREGVWRLRLMVTEGGFSTTLSPYEERCAPARLCICRSPPVAPSRPQKSFACFKRLAIMEEAARRGFDDAVTLSEEGFLLECAFSNIFWLRNQTLFTPDPALPLFFGITIQKEIESALKQGYKVEYVRAPPEQLPLDARYYTTNSMTLRRPAFLLI